MVKRQNISSMKSAMKAVSIKNSDPVIDAEFGRNGGEYQSAKSATSQETRMITVRMPKALLEELKVWQGTRNVECLNRTQIIIRAVEEYIEK